MNAEIAKTGEASLQPPIPELRIAVNSAFLLNVLNVDTVANSTVIGIISSNNKGNNNAVSFINNKKLNQSENIPLRFPKKFPVIVINTKALRNNRK